MKLEEAEKLAKADVKTARKTLKNEHLTALQDLANLMPIGPGKRNKTAGEHFAACLASYGVRVLEFFHDYPEADPAFPDKFPGAGEAEAKLQARLDAIRFNPETKLEIPCRLTTEHWETDFRLTFHPAWSKDGTVQVTWIEFGSSEPIGLTSSGSVDIKINSRGRVVLSDIDIDTPSDLADYYDIDE